MRRPFLREKKTIKKEIVFCYSGVIDFAVTKIGDYKVDFLGEY
jgi:hypothetical protein